MRTFLRTPVVTYPKTSMIGQCIWNCGGFLAPGSWSLSPSFPSPNITPKKLHYSPNQSYSGWYNKDKDRTLWIFTHTTRTGYKLMCLQMGISIAVGQLREMHSLQTSLQMFTLDLSTISDNLLILSSKISISFWRFSLSFWALSTWTWSILVFSACLRISVSTFSLSVSACKTCRWNHKIKAKIPSQITKITKCKQ